MSFHTKGSVRRAADAARDDLSSPNDVRIADAKRLIDLMSKIVRSVLTDPEPAEGRASKLLDQLVEVIERYNNYKR